MMKVRRRIPYAAFLADVTNSEKSDCQKQITRVILSSVSSGILPSQMVWLGDSALFLRRYDIDPVRRMRLFVERFSEKGRMGSDKKKKGRGLNLVESKGMPEKEAMAAEAPRIDVCLGQVESHG